MAAGLCLTGSTFHVLRIGPARKLMSNPIDPAVVRRHLKEP
ncbi:MAG: hypothetical protein AAGF92_03085 [Myxococcota bacterium]